MAVTNISLSGQSYTPSEAAERRKKIYEDLKAKLEAQGKDTSNLRISFAPELEPERFVEVPRDKRTPVKMFEKSIYQSPDEDMFCMTAQSSIKPPMMMAKVSPAEVLAWVGVIDALGGLIQKYGPEVVDMIVKVVSAGKGNPTVEDSKPMPNGVNPSPESDIPEDAVFNMVA